MIKKSPMSKDIGLFFIVRCLGLVILVGSVAAKGH
jgi:hypothetical protein